MYGIITDMSLQAPVFTSNHPCLDHCAEHADDHYSDPHPLLQLQAIIRKLNITAHDPVQSVIVPC